jgi:hypothetical protein
MGDLRQDWFRRRTSGWADRPAARLLELKQRLGTPISVVIPARNEERTVAEAVRSPGSGRPGSGRPGSGGPR